MEEKNSTQLPSSLETMAAAIADRCANDPDWMAKFKASPRQVLEETSGRKLPDDVQIHLHQNDDDNWHVPIAAGGGKLRDADLQRVAGGFEVWVVSLVTLGVAGGSVAAGAAVGGAVIGGVTTVDNKKKQKKK